jgi:hypothetical protein
MDQWGIESDVGLSTSENVEVLRGRIQSNVEQVLTLYISDCSAE